MSDDSVQENRPKDDVPATVGLDACTRHEPELVKRLLHGVGVIPRDARSTATFVLSMLFLFLAGRTLSHFVPLLAYFTLGFQPEGDSRVSTQHPLAAAATLYYYRCVAAPLTETLLFQAGVLTLCRKLNIGQIPSYLLSALLFALPHYLLNPNGSTSAMHAFGGGLVYAHVYWTVSETRGSWTPAFLLTALLHSVKNTLAVLGHLMSTQ